MWSELKNLNKNISEAIRTDIPNFNIKVITHTIVQNRCLKGEDVELAIKDMKNNRTTEEDGIVSEIIKTERKCVIKTLKTLHYDCLFGGSTLEKWNNVVMIILRK